MAVGGDVDAPSQLNETRDGVQLIARTVKNHLLSPARILHFLYEILNPVSEAVAPSTHSKPLYSPCKDVGYLTALHTMHLAAPQLTLAFLCALRAVVYAAAGSIAINVTVDDSLPASDTAGDRIVYGEGWSVGQDCPGCLVQPDRAEAYENSWHDTTYSVGVGNISRSSADATFDFTGMDPCFDLQNRPL